MRGLYWQGEEDGLSVLDNRRDVAIFSPTLKRDSIISFVELVQRFYSPGVLSVLTEMHSVFKYCFR